MAIHEYVGLLAKSCAAATRLGQTAKIALAAILFGAAVTVAASTALPERVASRYDQVIARVDAGALPAANGDNARAVSLALRQDLIRIDAEIQAARLAARETEGDAQTEALDEVVALSTRRERRIATAVQRLDRLNADLPAPEGRDDQPALAASPAAPTGDAVRELDGKDEPDESSIFDNIRIINEPEDLSAPTLE